MYKQNKETLNSHTYEYIIIFIYVPGAKIVTDNVIRQKHIYENIYVFA